MEEIYNWYNTLTQNNKPGPYASQTSVHMELVSTCRVTFHLPSDLITCSVPDST